jgi:hypothetical protein
MRARPVEDEAHEIMPNQWWKNMMLLNTISVTAILVTIKNGEAAKIVQHVTKSKKTRETRRVLLKNIFFRVSSNRRQGLFTVGIGRKCLDSHTVTPWNYLYSCKQGLRELFAMKLALLVYIVIDRSVKQISQHQQTLDVR